MCTTICRRRPRRGRRKAAQKTPQRVTICRRQPRQDKQQNQHITRVTSIASTWKTKDLLAPRGPSLAAQALAQPRHKALHPLAQGQLPLRQRRLQLRHARDSGVALDAHCVACTACFRELVLRILQSVAESGHLVLSVAAGLLLFPLRVLELLLRARELRGRGRSLRLERLGACAHLLQFPLLGLKLLLRA